ncbi:dihydrofolate reductase family protein [Sandaracinus amylolyticus]|uniref:Dihydrofolate reductase n=1 Tax=Sandaracinus amylolyticus TaxID=927083 RepID=A0A0F6W9J2_9BACT|nr:dihydrofolate reductase family protein [Sandaracinus amylolyticus]AKF10855.1 Dihydrofolate reductase [Sandaracinus amylolyticus]
MGKLTVTTFVTLDGVMQGPGGPDEDRRDGFTHGGWVVPYFDDALGAFVVDVFSRVDAFLLGRFTYDTFAAHWPRVTDPNDPIAAKLNALPKHVASRSMREASWNASSVIQGDVVEAVAALKKQYARELQVHGSAGLLQTLLRSDLVDELNVMQFPIVLGTGKRLFEPSVAPSALSLARSSTSTTGVVMSVYRRVGKPSYGSFALE